MVENMFPTVQITRLHGFKENPSFRPTQQCQQMNFSMQERFPVVEITRLPQSDEPCSSDDIGKQERFPVVEITRLPHSDEPCSSVDIGKQKNYPVSEMDKQTVPLVKIRRLPQFDEQSSCVHIGKEIRETVENHQDQVFPRCNKHRHRLSTCYKSGKINSCEVDVLVNKTFDCNNCNSNLFQQQLLSDLRIHSCKRRFGKAGQQSVAIKLHNCIIPEKMFLFENNLAQHKLIHLRQKSCKSENFNPAFTVKKCTVNIERLRNSGSFTPSKYNENISSSVQQDIQSFNRRSLREITSNDIVGIDSGVASRRMLNDDELWARIEKLNSNNILVLHPAVCLKAKLSDKKDICNILVDVNGSKHIIAPISNARSDRLTGYNTEGTHWSLIVVDIDRQKYYHLDSLPGVNHSSALQFCKNINVLLKLKPFRFSTKKCKQQSDSYSCGWEVIKNARKEVYLLKNRRLCSQNKISKKVIVRQMLSMTF